MFGIGMPEMLLILAIALIVIGPKKLPDLARSLGKAMGEFKKATSELKDSIQLDSELKDVNAAFKDINAGSDKTPPAADSTAEASVSAQDAAPTAAVSEEPDDAAVADAPSPPTAEADKTTVLPPVDEETRST